MATPYRQLNVTDALSYLEQVKVQFQDQHEVYNRFLDIMKDFKSQTIDTPGVIDRVSNLFRGHPSLIQGFNTFLPPGYHIECSNNPHEPNTIRVTTPSGTTSTSTTAAGDGHHSQGAGVAGSVSNAAGSSFYPTTTYPGRAQPSSMIPQLQAQNPALQQPYHLSGSQQTMGLVQSSQTQQQGKRPPVEFNHAINYVNKIKNRFSAEPDTYKQFLEILQTYQKEQKPIQDVYQQVAVLFKNAPDLLDEFKQFLPDTSGNAPSGGLFPTAHHTTKQSHVVPLVSSSIGMGAISQRLPPVGNFPPPSAAATAGDGYKKGIGSSGGPSPSVGSMSSVPAVAGTPGGSKKKRIVSTADRSPNIPVSKSKKSKVQHRGSDIQTSPTLQPMRSSELSKPAKQTASSEELVFFEKVKKFLPSKVFNEFLKLINLYSQHILDTNLVVERVRGFLGQNPELFEWFKQFVKYDDRDELVQNTAYPRPRVDLEGARAVGPSYRQLPKSECQLPCSGRDEMCWEVLNDEWVSHPTWASEDSGFVAHKKNQFEEALHKCEEERYEYDMFIEANLHTIALLEPIAKKIVKMSPEEKVKFKLEPGIGGKSMIYQRVIKKVYDQEKGIEVLDALHNNPAMAVPVVLRRLKQKDEEWKRAQREWNKIWREIDQKNYYKSLDHQGITFKTDDKRALNTKSLIAEIEALRREPRDDGQEGLEYQYKFFFKDMSVFKDVARILYSYMDRSGHFSRTDRERLQQFFKSFVTSFFDLPPTFFDEFQSMNNDMLIDEDANDYKFTDNNVEAASLTSEPLGGMWIHMSKESKDDIKAVVAKAGHGKPKRHSTIFFGNANFYCFFRFLQILFSRLESMKEGGNDKPSSTANTHNRGQGIAAAELDVQNSRLEDLDMDLNGDPYVVLLDLIDKLFDTDLDNASFEEWSRYIYGTKAYIMFTVDRLVQNMTKLMQTIVADSKSSVLLKMFEENKQQNDQSVRPLIMYQLHANNTIGFDDHTYRIEYDKEEKSLMILLSGRDYTLSDAVSSEEKWAYYMYSYMSLNPTEGVPTRSRRPFLKRNMPPVDIAEPQMSSISTRNGLEIKICINSYHVFFVNNTEDSFKRMHPTGLPDPSQEDRVRRKERWHTWLKSRQESPDAMET